MFQAKFYTFCLPHEFFHRTCKTSWKFDWNQQNLAAAVRSVCLLVKVAISDREINCLKSGFTTSFNNPILSEFEVSLLQAVMFGIPSAFSGKSLSSGSSATFTGPSFEDAVADLGGISIPRISKLTLAAKIASLTLFSKMTTSLSTSLRALSVIFLSSVCMIAWVLSADIRLCALRRVILSPDTLCLLSLWAFWLKFRKKCSFAVSSNRSKNVPFCFPG